MPAVPLSQHPAEEIAQRAADRNGDIEPGEDLAAALLREEVGDEPGRYRAETRLTDSDGGTGGQQGPVAGGKTGQGRGQTPDDQASGSKPGPAPVVAEPAEERGEEQVAEHEGAAEKPQRRIGEMQIDLDQGKYREEHLPVDVVKQVHRQKEPQGVAAVRVSRSDQCSCGDILQTQSNCLPVINPQACFCTH